MASPSDVAATHSEAREARTYTAGTVPGSSAADGVCRALPRLDAAVVVVESKCRRPGQRRASQKRAGGNSRGNAAGFGKLVEHVYIVDARQTVGAERHVEIHGVERFKWR